MTWSQLARMHDDLTRLYNRTANAITREQAHARLLEVSDRMADMINEADAARKAGR
jgi:hypothetical protein